MAYNFIGEPEQAIAYADKAMRLNPHAPAAMWPTLYLAKAIAFSMLQDYEEALVWIERAEAAAPDILFMGFVRSALLALAGKEDEARAAMQRYLANDNAPIRTISQWHARQSEKPLPSYNPLVLARLLKFEEEIRRRPPNSRTAGVSNRGPAADEAACLVWVNRVGLTAYRRLPLCPRNGHPRSALHVRKVP